MKLTDIENLKELSKRLQAIDKERSSLIAQIRPLCDRIALAKATADGEGIGTEKKGRKFTYRITRISGDFSTHRYEFGGIRWWGQKIKKDGSLGVQEHQLARRRDWNVFGT